MALSYGYQTVKFNRLCCCPTQEKVTQREIDRLPQHPEYQLRNLPQTFAPHMDDDILTIRQMFMESSIPFRAKGCSRGNMVCCCSCVRRCSSRCPQDVMNRAYLFCAHLLEMDQDNPLWKERWESTPVSVQLLYMELTTTKQYHVILAMVTDLINAEYNPQLQALLEKYGNTDSPHKLDYAPQVAYTEVFNKTKGISETKKLVDPETGAVAILNWPRSGMCPFCLPNALSDRRVKPTSPNALKKHPERH